MKAYESPMAELIEFGHSRIDTAGSRCDCYTEQWNYTSYNLDDLPDPLPSDDCKLVTKAFSELAQAEYFF